MKKKRLRNSFKGKVMLNSILIATLPVIILGLFLIVFFQKQTQYLMEQKIEDSLISINKRFDTDLNHYKDLVYVFEKEFKQSENPTQVLTKIYQNLGSNYEYIKTTIISQDGQDSLSTGTIADNYRLPKYNNWGIFRELNKTDDIIYYTHFHKNENFNSSLTIAHKFYYQDKIYYIMIDFSTEYFQNIILDFKHQGFGTQQFIFVGPGKEILYNDSQFTNAIHFYDQIFIENRFSSTDLKLEQGEMLFTEGIKNHKTGVQIFGLIPNSYLRNQLQVNGTLIGVLVLISITLGSIVGVKLGNQLTYPIITLAKLLEEIDQEDLESLDFDVRNDEIGYITKEIESLIFRLNESHEKNLEQAQLLKKTEMKALMSQMNPHFLYNTLETIKWNARFSGNKDIEEIVTELGYLLHESMNQRDTIITLERELEFIKNYINIQKRRYGEKFEFILNVQEGISNHKIPKFLLQPLIENALVHGIEPKESNGIIELNIWADMNFLYFSVADDGIGSSRNLKEMDSEHIGLNNINERIKLHYGQEHSIEWWSKPSEGTTVYIKIPNKEVEDKHV